MLNLKNTTPKNIVDEKFIELKNELTYIAQLHNLHIIEVTNIFNDSIKKAYNLPIKNTIVAINDSSQILIYDIYKKTTKVINLSQIIFKDIVKIFNKTISQKSDINLVNSLKSKLLNSENLELVKVKKTRKYLYLKPKNDNIFKSEFIFKHKIFDKKEEDFINANENFIITVNKKIIEQIKSIHMTLQNNEIECSIIDKSFNKKLIRYFLYTIRNKTNNKFDIRVDFINNKDKYVILTCNKYLPFLFIKYIENYIHCNITYKTFLKR